MLIFWTRRDCRIFYVRDETETRLNSKFRARPRREVRIKPTRRDRDETAQKFSSETRPRQDKFPNLVRDRDKTGSLGTFSLETETRPRLSSFTEMRVWHTSPRPPIICLIFLLCQLCWPPRVRPPQWPQTRCFWLKHITQRSWHYDHSCVPSRRC